MKNRRKLQLQALVDSKCTYIGINKQLVKKEQIKTRLAEILFKVFNVNSIKNGKFTRFVLLEIKINKYKEQVNTAVMDLNGIDMFLRYN